eukprot:Sspe_Gene.101989::Locus_76682_Transcript_1_1_Confidence_1.000_Length_2872::g.101989::m.101989
MFTAEEGRFREAPSSPSSTPGTPLLATPAEDGVAQSPPLLTSNIIRRQTRQQLEAQEGLFNNILFAFRLIDQDGDGIISPRDLYTVLRAHRYIHITPQDAALMCTGVQESSGVDLTHFALLFFIYHPEALGSATSAVLEGVDRFGDLMHLEAFTIQSSNLGVPSPMDFTTGYVPSNLLQVYMCTTLYLSILALYWTAEDTVVSLAHPRGSNPTVKAFISTLIVFGGTPVLVLVAITLLSARVITIASCLAAVGWGLALLTEVIESETAPRGWGYVFHMLLLATCSGVTAITAANTEDEALEGMDTEKDQPAWSRRRLLSHRWVHFMCLNAFSPVPVAPNPTRLFSDAVRMGRMEKSGKRFPGNQLVFVPVRIMLAAGLQVATSLLMIYTTMRIAGSLSSLLDDVGHQLESLSTIPPNSTCQGVGGERAFNITPLSTTWGEYMTALGGNTTVLFALPLIASYVALAATLLLTRYGYITLVESLRANPDLYNPKHHPPSHAAYIPGFAVSSLILCFTLTALVLGGVTLLALLAPLRRALWAHRTLWLPVVLLALLQILFLDKMLLVDVAHRTGFPLHPKTYLFADAAGCFISVVTVIPFAFARLLLALLSTSARLLQCGSTFLPPSFARFDPGHTALLSAAFASERYQNPFVVAVLDMFLVCKAATLPVSVRRLYLRRLLEGWPVLAGHHCGGEVSDSVPLVVDNPSYTFASTLARLCGVEQNNLTIDLEPHSTSGQYVARVRFVGLPNCDVHAQNLSIRARDSKDPLRRELGVLGLAKEKKSVPTVVSKAMRLLQGQAERELVRRYFRRWGAARKPRTIPLVPLHPYLRKWMQWTVERRSRRRLADTLVVRSLCIMLGVYWRRWRQLVSLRVALRRRGRGGYFW